MNRFLLTLLYCAPWISLWAQPPSEAPFVNRLQIKQQWRIHDAGIEQRVQGVKPIMRYRKAQGELLQYPLYDK